MSRRFIIRVHLMLLTIALGFGAISSRAATSPANATVRIPRNIRVLQTNGVVTYVSMETYVGRVLYQEWYASWANYAGGSNSLKAGAVVVRSYAINRLQSVATNSSYDICASTSCQVYRSTSNSSTTNAADQTAGYVVASSAYTIQGTEYSAENNSLGYSCGDGYTQPTGGCISDPVCAGETRFGHGRGLCQWGSAKWATGLKMLGNGANYSANADSGATNGYPKQSWDWIVDHYYPGSILLQGKPLVDGDDVQTAAAVPLHSSAGMNTASVGTKASGSTGVILTNAANGVLVTNDGFGFTWYQVQWSDSTVSWTPENWLQRIVPAPSAPFNLTATALSPTQIKLSWADTNVTELGFEIQRSPLTNGNWSQLTTVAPNLTTYSDTNVLVGTTYYYRIRAYHAGGNSSFSNTTNATPIDIAPVLSSIPNYSIVEGTLLTFTNSATDPDFEVLLNDFEPYATGSGVMFRNPNFSGSTSSFLDSSSSANIAATTTTFPPGTNQDAQVLNLAWTFTNTSNPWLRLTTSSATNMPNPVIDFTKKLKFDIYADKSLKIALGCRETTNATGTAIGSNGGNGGTIEWAGSIGKLGTGPNPTKTVSPTNWQTVTFDIPTEPTTNFTGDGLLSTASGLGVLEHLAFVPNAGPGAYNVYLDNFIVASPKTLTYSLGTNAPAGASVNPSTGVFTWIPGEAQGPGTYSITVRVTDDASPPQSDTKTFSVTVTESNSAPVLVAVTNYSLHAGSTLTFTNLATDSDIPANTLIYSLTNAPAGASVTSNGVFTWTPLDAQANTTNTITVKVVDNGAPPLSDSKSFNVTVAPRPILQSTSVTGGTFTFNWSAISGKKYQVQYKDDLGAASWTNLTSVTASSATAAFSEAVGITRRFYRIIDVN